MSSLTEAQETVVANLREHHGDTIHTVVKRSGPRAKSAVLSYDVDGCRVEIVVTADGRLRIHTQRPKRA